MFVRWGSFVYRFRRPLVLLPFLLALAAAPFATRASGELTSGGWIDPSAESTRVSDRLAAEFGSGRSSIVVLYSAPAGTDAGGLAFQSAITASLARIRSDPRVTGVVDEATTGAPRFVSLDRRETYAVVQLAASDDQSVPVLPALRAEIETPPGANVKLTGYAPLSADSSHQSELDLQRAEVVSLPVALLILTIVFGSLVAAALPLIVAGLAIPSALGLVYLAARFTSMSVFVLNVGTMLGLALAIDYSLFLVSRFREELMAGRAVDDAVVRAVATSGKAVTFSGVTVAIGLSGLFLLRAPALGSIGVGGALVVLCSVFYALVFLPALLGVLGPRVDRLSVRWLLRRLRLIGGEGASPSRWERVARAVMAHPVMVLVPVLAVLLLVGTPVLGMQQGVPGASIYPPGLESRDAYVALQQDFPPGETSPIVVLADVHGHPASRGNVLALAVYAAELGRMPGVTHVESPFSGLRDPSTGRPLDPARVADLYALPPGQRPAGLDALFQAYVRGSTVQLDVISSLDPSTPAATDQIPAIRAIPPGDGITTQVGGMAAGGYDFLASTNGRLPLVIGVVLGAMLLVLFLLFGSLVLPVKAVVMTLLSITASFGALVWVFQDGHLQQLLDFQSPGYTIAGDPIIMFCVLFGLSMDYEVLLLSRIQEAYRRTGDNTAAVAEGLTRTASVITGAAMIMVSVFAAFVLAQTLTIKSLGVGMAVAVFVDATVIRVLLVPATMRLLGRWNWWAPGPLGAVAGRSGFSHVEGELAPEPVRVRID